MIYDTPKDIHDTLQPGEESSSQVDFMKNICYGDISIRATENVAYGALSIRATEDVVHGDIAIRPTENVAYEDISIEAAENADYASVSNPWVKFLPDLIFKSFYFCAASTH